MGIILRSKDTPESLFREVVDTTMHDVLNRVPEKDDPNGKFIVFDSMDEILERGYVSYDKSKEREEQREKERKNEMERREILEAYNCGFKKTSTSIDEMFDESWINSESDDVESDDVESDDAESDDAESNNAECNNAECNNAKIKSNNYVWQRVFLEIFTSISESSKMKDFSNQIAYEYGIAVWNTIFDKYQRFFIMLWRMNTSYLYSNPKQKELISLIKSFFKSIRKVSRKLSKEFPRLDLDYSSAKFLKDFFRKLLKETLKDEDASKKMCEINKYFAENFGKMLWYERFSKLQRFIIICSEACRIWQLFK